MKNMTNQPHLKEIFRSEYQGLYEVYFSAAEELSDDTKFDLEYIKDLHLRMFRKLYLFAGHYRTTELENKNFRCARYEEIPGLMKNLDSEWLNNMPAKFSSREELIKFQGAIHGSLLYIQPFRKGNGWVARLLADLINLKAGENFLDWDLAADEYPDEYNHSTGAAGEGDFEPMRRLIGKIMK